MISGDEPNRPELTIRPFQGVGDIDFGMSREQVEQILGPPDQVIPRGEETEEWIYRGLDASVCFDHLGQFNEASMRGAVGVIAGVPLSGTASEVIAKLSELGYHPRAELFPTRYGEIDIGNYIVDDIGVIIHRPHSESDEVAGVRAFRPGDSEDNAVASPGGERSGGDQT